MGERHQSTEKLGVTEVEAAAKRRRMGEKLSRADVLGLPDELTLLSL